MEKKELERDVEKRLIKEVKARGGLTYKFVSPNNPGVPDRIIIMPGGHVHFVELKTETGRLSGLQKWQIDQLQKAGAHVVVLYGIGDVEFFAREVLSSDL